MKLIKEYSLKVCIILFFLSLFDAAGRFVYSGGIDAVSYAWNECRASNGKERLK